jgi:hypothetical protein
MRERLMREDASGRPRLLSRNFSVRARTRGVVAYFAAVSVILAGLAGTLGARRGTQEAQGDHPKGETKLGQRRAGKSVTVQRTPEHGHHGRHGGAHADGHRHEHGGNAGNVNQLKATSTPTPTPTRTPNAGKGNGGGGGGGGGGGNKGGGTSGGKHHGNKGNGGADLFNRPLATKARRRAKNFANAGQNKNKSTGIVVNADSQNKSTFQTDGISYTTGPDGIEIVTRNIDYKAAFTPTPTPFPTLEIPTREASIFVSPPSAPAATTVPPPPSSSSPPPSSSSPPPPVSPPPPRSSPPPPSSPPSPPPPSASGGATSTAFAS